MPACFMNSSTDLVATELPLKSVLESLKKRNFVDELLLILHTNTFTLNEHVLLHRSIFKLTTAKKQLKLYSSF